MAEAGFWLARRGFHFGGLLLVLGAILVVKLYAIQISGHEDYDELLQKKLTRTEHLRTGRGRILDREGGILAEDVPGSQLAFTPAELALESGIVQEVEYCLNPRQKKYRPLFQGGILASREELAAKIRALPPRLVREPLVQDLAQAGQLDADLLARELAGCLENCLKQWYYLGEAQAVDVFVPRRLVQRIMADPSRWSGVSCLETSTRRYPRGGTAAQVVGYIGRLSEQDYNVLRVQGFYQARGLDLAPIVLNDVERFSLSMIKQFLVGAAGTELAYNNELRSQLGRIRRLRMPGEERVVDECLPDEGQDVTLCLDPDLQEAAEAAMNGRDGVVVLVDLDTGDILVSLSNPAYDPNRLVPPGDPAFFEEVKGKAGVFVNKAAAATYPFGSVFKIVTATAALEERLVERRSVVNCQRKHERTGLSCLGHHGDIDVETALEKSCNVFFFEAGLRLGELRLHNWAVRFGLGAPPGTGFPYEKGGVVPHAGYKRERGAGGWFPGDTCNTAIGQGYQLGSPLQAALVAGLAGRAVVARPRYWMDRPVETIALDLRPETREAVRSGLWKVVNSPGGTARDSASTKVVYAGKTGTADVTRHPAGHPDYIPPHAWFAGFAPFAAPRVAIAVLLERGGHGGQEAAPVAKAVFEAWQAKQGRGKPPAAPVTAGAGR